MLLTGQCSLIQTSQVNFSSFLRYFTIMKSGVLKVTTEAVIRIFFSQLLGFVCLMASIIEHDTKPQVILVQVSYDC